MMICDLCCKEINDKGVCKSDSGTKQNDYAIYRVKDKENRCSTRYSV